MGAFLLALIAGLLFSTGAQSAAKREAYVALFYGEDEGFLLGIRALGQSLKEAGTTKEMVAMCPPSVQGEVKLTLMEDGWTVITIDPSAINYQGPFQGHVMKLSVLTLTQFSKVALLDTDVTAYEGVDDVFDCGGYCAVMRHSNQFNSGVMVLTPSHEHFAGILALLAHWNPLEHSHQGGDQDILNAYFRQIPLAPTYNKTDVQRRHNQPQFAQLPFEYNMDVGMYYLRDKWLIDRKDYRFLHYTLGEIRPWQWLTYPLFDQNWVWQRFRSHLDDPSKDFFTSSLRYAPIYLSVLFTFFRIVTYGAIHRAIAEASEFSSLKQTLRKLFPFFISSYRITLMVGTASSVLLPIYIIPSHLRPLEGWFYYIFLVYLFVFHVFEFHYVVLHYGCSPTLETSKRSKGLQMTHMKVIMLSFVYLLSCLYTVMHIELFSTRVKAAIIMAGLLIIYLYLTSQYLVSLYVQHAPVISPVGSPGNARKTVSY